MGTTKSQRIQKKKEEYFLILLFCFYSYFLIELTFPFFKDAYDVDQLLLKWKSDSAIDVNSEIKMPDMILRKLEPHARNDTYATGNNFATTKITYQIFGKSCFRSIAKETGLAW